MSSDEVTKGKGNGRTTLSDFFKDISPNQNFTEYLKRFFYQIIGIYFQLRHFFCISFCFGTSVLTSVLERIQSVIIV
jgi:hypothetical protein